MSSPISKGRIQSTLREFLSNEASGGLVLMAVAFMAILTANSPLAGEYFRFFDIYVGPLTLQHWINDALMAFFFLLVGLEIKREMLEGQLSSWSRRILPAATAAGGMLFPALFYVFLNWSDPTTLRGWAIPTATDIAFALGVISLFGSRVPSSLKIFLAALAIIDDLGAVVVIAAFYTADLNVLALLGAAFVWATLLVLNRFNIKALWPYLGLGGILWALVFASGVHATLAGVMLALAIPLKLTPRTPGASTTASPHHRLEHVLHKPVAFVVVPLFGFANAGVPLSGLTISVLSDPLTVGVAGGLVLGKLVGVLGTVFLLVKFGLARLPAQASWGQLAGTAFLCGIGFTMSLFIGLLAFEDPAVQQNVKIGIIMGSVASGVLGAIFLGVFARHKQT